MKPSIPRGTRDFGSAEMLKRNYIFSIIRKNFELFGYEPIETPAMENLSTLLGKYGEEGDKLIFKIQNSGAAINGSEEELDKLFTDYKINYNSPNKNLLAGERVKAIEKVKGFLTEKGLRYDLTVPFARYVVMNQHNLTFPFKRYQIQPVWRADKPQKGRYREFWQCDADVIGSNSLVNEVELVQLISDVFAQLEIPVIIKLNNRKILSGIAEVIGEKDKIIDITVAIDKLDKININGVNLELKEKGIPDLAIQKLQPLINFKGNENEKIQFLKEFLMDSEIGLMGVSEMEYIFEISKDNRNFENATSTLELDLTLARGLNYYTGTIFEVKANAGTFTPSILGGGRYDDLTGIFGLKNISGVGISFGIDRIYDVMDELNSFQNQSLNSLKTELLIVHTGEEEQKHAIKLAKSMRNQFIRTEIYPDVTKKITKQFEYADKKQIPWVCIVGSEELITKKYKLKQMAIRHEDEPRSLNEILSFFASLKQDDNE